MKLYNVAIVFALIAAILFVIGFVSLSPIIILLGVIMALSSVIFHLLQNNKDNEEFIKYLLKIINLGKNV